MRIDWRRGVSSVLIGIGTAAALGQTTQELPSAPDDGQPLISCAYDVSDLLAWPPAKLLATIELTPTPGPATAGSPDAPNLDKRMVKTDLENTIYRILAHQADGSQIDIGLENKPEQIGVMGSPKAQAAVTTFLDALRQKKYSTPVTLAIQSVCLDTATAADILNLSGSDQINQLIQAGKREGSIVNAPKIIVYNAQTAHVWMGTSYHYVGDLIFTRTPAGQSPPVGDGLVAHAKTQTVDAGIDVTATPKVSLDRASVVVDLKRTFTTLLRFDHKQLPGGNPLWQVQVPREMVRQVEAKVAIPDKQTVVLQVPVVRNDADSEPGQKMLIMLTANILGPQTTQ